MRDALHGYTRFDQFQQSLGIAPNMLTRRLNALVDAGLLARRRYSEHPPRDEYVPTARGVDFRPVLVALLAWGNRHFAPEGASVQIVNAKTSRRCRTHCRRPRDTPTDCRTRFHLRCRPSRTGKHSPSLRPGRAQLYRRHTATAARSPSRQTE